MFKLHTLVALIGCSLAASSFAMNIQPDPLNPGGFIVSKADLQEKEALLTADPMYKIWAKALETIPSTYVIKIKPGLATNPENVVRAERIFPETDWNYLVDSNIYDSGGKIIVKGMAADEYTYTRLLRAIGKFPAFCGTYTDGRDSDAICKKSIITAFAHFAQETGGHIALSNTSDNPKGLEEWRQGLVHVRELGWKEGQAGYITGCGQNDWQNKRWPCALGQGYFGRGAKQLSYHFNYGAFSEVMFDGDATVLLNNPGKVADSWLNLASAIWFFMTPQAPKPAMLHVIDRTWVPSAVETANGIGYGFGTTINIINGGIECGAHNKDKGQPVNRIRYWKGLESYYKLPTPADEKATCHQQTPYGSLKIKGRNTNWEGNWDYYKDRPANGASFECKLVSYQTAYSALVKGDYEKCVTNFYGSHQTWPQVRTVVDLLPPPPPNQKWDADKIYYKGDSVVVNKVTYMAKYWNQGVSPLVNGEYDKHGAWTQL